MNDIAAVAAVATLGLALQAFGGPPIHIGGRLELMVDDYLIEELRGGAQLRLHPPVRRDVAMVTDAPWEGNACHYRSVFQ
ncbi:MAG: hypothetical protein FJ272_19315, partial [Planctomycetes bacterium]|nr:hypothetical protein [Planctomycetota bacterium]